MDQAFQAAYKQLNDRQRQAVDAIEGPVLVVAGPGTGKTQLLSLRVANILRKTDADPSSILCLTFTNFAATNMRERLSRLVGSTAHNVVVRTFHSFAAEIMNLYPEYFWNGARLTIAPEATQLEIIENILTSLPFKNPLAMKFAGNFTALPDVQSALKLSKEAGLTPEKLRAMIEVNQAYIEVIESELIDLLAPTLSIKRLPDLAAGINALPDQPINESVTPLLSLSTVLKDSFQIAYETDMQTGKATETGKWKRRWLQTVNGQKGLFDEKRRNDWWLALAGVYEHYRDQLHAQGYYDYSDMIVEVISQLEQQPELLASVQERFLYVLIDEFQDTNAAQMRLAHLVASHYSDADRPNLMAVGDDDQSIFAFNGAELNNMLTFQRSYPSTQTIILQDNYRSTQAILDTVASIVEQADDRLVTRQPNLTKHISARATVAAGEINHYQYPTNEHQLAATADKIAKHWREDPKQTIAVLARQHSSLRAISARLQQLQIPISYEQQNNIFDQPLIQQILLLSTIVVAIQNGDNTMVDEYLPQLLQYPAWQVPANELWQLALQQRDRKTAQASWLDALNASSLEHQTQLGQWLFWLAQQAADQPLDVMWEYLVGLQAGSHMTSPLRDYYLANKAVTSDYLTGLSALRTLQHSLREFTASQGGQARLNDLLRLWQIHRDLNKPIVDESWFVSGEQAVQLMTVHKAKGLEFDTVFVLDLVENNWRPRHIGRKPPANLPLQPYGEQYDDYVRLLYVAATRAKSSLIVSSYQYDEAGASVLASPLISNLPHKTITEDRQSAVPILESALRWPRLESHDEHILLAPRLEHYRLSATHLLHFLDVTSGGPQRFLERHLLGVPEPTGSAMAFGTAIHTSLQIAQLITNQDRFNLKSVQQAFENSLRGQQLPLSEEVRYLEHGQQLLTDLFITRDFQLTSGGQAEIALNNVELDTIRLNGAFDLLNTTADSLLITDYKTGQPLTSLSTRDQTKAVKAWRHRTQLQFYALLVKHSGRYRKLAIDTRIVYVEAETLKDTSLLYTPTTEDLDQLEQLIHIVWQHIMDLDFPDIRHYPETIAGIHAFMNDLLQGEL